MADFSCMKNGKPLSYPSTFSPFFLPIITLEDATKFRPPNSHHTSFRFAGWWGHDPATRFTMPPTFSPIPGAQGFQQSNPSILTTVSLLGSLQVFKQVGWMNPLRERSIALTARLEALLHQTGFYVSPEEAGRYAPDGPPRFTIITPKEPERRGTQLSLLFLPLRSNVMEKIFNHLRSEGVIADERKPDVIRVAPAPLYSTAKDCERAAECFKRAFEAITKTN